MVNPNTTTVMRKRPENKAQQGQPATFKAQLGQPNKQQQQAATKHGHSQHHHSDKEVTSNKAHQGQPARLSPSLAAQRLQ